MDVLWSLGLDWNGSVVPISCRLSMPPLFVPDKGVTSYRSFRLKIGSLLEVPFCCFSVLLFKDGVDFARDIPFLCGGGGCGAV